MIASLNGKLIYSDAVSVVVECGGVGLKCFVTKNTLSSLPNIGENIFLHTHMNVREDAIDLYGFKEIEELNTFKLITSVSGVGSKIGIALLSQFSASKICLCIASGDAKLLTAASGVGIKLAQRIVLELKDKVGAIPSSAAEEMEFAAATRKSSSASEAIEALISLGYNKTEATQAVLKLDGTLSSGELIKQALKALSRR